MTSTDNLRSDLLDIAGRGPIGRQIVDALLAAIADPERRPEILSGPMNLEIVHQYGWLMVRPRSEEATDA